MCGEFVSFNGDDISVIVHKIQKILIENIKQKSSLDSKLRIFFSDSTRIFCILKVIAKILIPTPVDAYEQCDEIFAVEIINERLQCVAQDGDKFPAQSYRLRFELECRQLFDFFEIRQC